MADKKNKSYMYIEPAPSKPTPPKTFTDGPIEPGWGAGGANGYTTRSAKPGNTIGPIPRTKKITRTNPMRSA